MNIVCIGGGPAGLYFGLLMKKLNPAHRVRVIERNKPYDTFGWGVVFSDATMDNMRRCDAETSDEISQAFNHWDDIELLFKGRRIRSGGHGFVGIGRKKLLNILQARCEQLGVELVFETEAGSDEDYPDADLIIASDGINSRIRGKYAGVFKPDIVVRPNRFIWLGTHKLYDAFTFDFQRTEHGWFQAHIYKFDEQTTTFIVECPESVWLAHGLDKADQEQSIAFCEKVFADNLQGAKLMTNARHLRGSAWLNFQRVVCEQWWLKNARGSHVVLMGDAVHTAHFAIGSGTKLAIEDAIELARLFEQHGDDAAHIPEVLVQYQAARRIETLRIQNAAWNAMEWFEVCGERYCDQLEPEQFMYSMLTRSQRISHENLRLRDKTWLEGYERWLAARTPLKADTAVPPMFTPYTCRSITLKNRVVVSPMAQYSAVEGIPGDYHLVHLGARATGGAGLVFAEMTCTSADARITPGCPGLWNDEQMQAWKRIVDWVHANSDAKMAMQLGHAGPKGSTNAPWDGQGADQPLPTNNWPLIAASAAAVPRRRCVAARDDARRHGPRRGRFRRRHKARGASRLRLARTALRARLSALGLHLAADQSPRRRVRRLARQAPAISARSLHRGTRSLAAAPADVGAHLRARLGRGRHHTGRRGADRARVQGRRRRHDRLFVGAGERASRSPRTAACTRRRSPTESARRPASRRLPSARSAKPITSIRSSPPDVRTCALLQGRTWPTRHGL